ncbi:MAG TPA: glutathione S-transferase family protein [Kofleriaceae bacterium]|nr:glutathione S-transferase family protein [Kofleriaceae bacterium]
MKLYGTTTSPFVRRVRVVAAEVAEPVELINTAPDEGQAELRRISPIRKVPVAVVDATVAGGLTLFDSRVIIEWLTTTHGWADLTPTRGRWHEQNIINAIDAALDAVIQLFYLRRDGVAVDGSPYAERQLARADAIFAWLGTKLVDGRSFSGGFGLPELALISALDWMDFRKTYETSTIGAVEAVREAWRDRPSLASTMPHA